MATSDDYGSGIDWNEFPHANRVWAVAERPLIHFLSHNPIKRVSANKKAATQSDG